MLTEEEKKRVAREIIVEYQQSRLDSYGKMRLNQLLGKDTLLFAARGISTAHGFVNEAFLAAESSSEETVMGNSRQALAIRLGQALDGGDLIIVRDGIRYVCEMKSQTNTTNAGGLAAVLQELRKGIQDQQRAMRVHRTVSSQEVRGAILVSRSSKSKDEELVYHANTEAKRTYPGIDGFSYRYISGVYMWRWVAGVDDPIELFDSIGGLDPEGKLEEARKNALARIHRDLDKQLERRGLPDSIDSIYALVCERRRV